MNANVHIDAVELMSPRLQSRFYGASQARRMVLLDPAGSFTVWVKSAGEARDVAAAWLALAFEIEADDRRASMDTLPEATPSCQACRGRRLVNNPAGPYVVPTEVPCTQCADTLPEAVA